MKNIDNLMRKILLRENNWLFLRREGLHKKKNLLFYYKFNVFYYVSNRI
jgi:hypothetical protein